MKKNHHRRPWYKRLFANSRFWILATGIVLSINIAGFVQLMIPSGSLQIIRIEQIYGFVAIFLLFLALLASPLTKAYPNLPFKDGYLHARRAIGVLTFYYAFLHVYLTFFKQLGGWDGIQYYNTKYSWSLLLGVVALGILSIMAATSFDWVVDHMGYKHWKLLHRLVYLAGLAILVHVALIGPHYAGLGFLSTLTAVAVVVLLWLEGLRIYRNIIGRKGHGNTSSTKTFIVLAAGLGVLGVLARSGSAKAHVLQTDGTIGAILHINPDDNPLSGRSVEYVLSFDDTANRFSLPDCDCTVTVRKNGGAIATLPLNSSSDQESTNTFTFPSPAVYVLDISGRPKRPGAFQPFTLTYTVRVSSGDTQLQTVPPLLWVGLGGMIGLIVLAAYASEMDYTKTEKQGGNV